MEKIHWGLMGTGCDAEGFAKGLAYMKDAVLEAIVSKTSRDKAGELAVKYNINKVYDSYEAFFADPEIEIVYVSLLPSEHKQMILDCFQAGKAVVCVPPVALNAEETEEIIRAAKESNCFFMEAMCNRFLPVAKIIRQWLWEGRIGKIKYLRADHGFFFEDRGGHQFDPKTGGGATMVLGICTISFISMVLGYEPTEVRSLAVIGENGVDEQSVISLRYPENEIAVISCSMLAETPQEAWIVGDEGVIRLKKAFMNADTVTLEMESKLSDEPTIMEKVTIPMEVSRYCFVAEEAMRCLRQRRKESDILPLDETKGVMRILDMVRRQWSLQYPSA